MNSGKPISLSHQLNDYNAKFENFIEETLNSHIKFFTSKMLFKNSFCNLLIAIFKMKRWANQNTNILSANTNILKSLSKLFYIVKFKT